MSANDVQIGGDHYKSKAIQPWDAMKVWMTPEEFRGFLKGNAIKYLARSNDKGGLQDIQKAGHYIQKLIELLEQRSTEPAADGVKYIIRNSRDLSLLWNKNRGWVTTGAIDGYDVFLPDEKHEYRLPRDGMWEQAT